MLAREAARITFAIHTFVVAAGVFGHMGQVLGPRQGFEHLNGEVYVMVDDLAFFGGECAGADGQVLDLIFGQEIAFLARRIDPAVLGCDLLHAFDVFVAHEFATHVGMPDEGAIVIHAFKLFGETRLTRAGT